MANKSQINLTGFKELEAALLKLPHELAKTVEASALRYGMIPVRKSAQNYAKAAKDTGQLYKSIGLTVKRVRKKGQTTNRYTARVGPRGGFAIVLGTRQKGKKKGSKIIRDPRYYAHLVEYGTSRAPAQPFIRPAITSNEAAIIDGMAAGYEKGLARAVAKLRKS